MRGDAPDHQEIDTVTEAVLGDLTWPDGSAPGVAFETISGERGTVVSLQIDGVVRREVAVYDVPEPRLDEERRWQLRWIAYHLADAFGDEVAELTRSPRPCCPHHAVMLNPEFAGEWVEWRCARCGWRCPVGEYGVSVEDAMNSRG